MKKNLLFLFGLFFMVMSVSATLRSNWSDCAVCLTKDGGANYYYLLNGNGSTNDDWLNHYPFNGYDFGTPSSLVLNGGEGNGKTDLDPGYTENSFILYYRVYKTGTTPGGWSHIALGDLKQKIEGEYSLYSYEKLSTKKS